MRAYEPEWIPDLGHDVAKIELPFCVKQPHESPEEFAVRADRDFGLIKRFTVKFAIKKHGVQQLVADMIVDQLKLHVTKVAAFARAFLNNVEQKVAEPLLEVLYEECISNLPAQFRDGGLDPTMEKPAVRRQQQAQLPFNSIGQSALIRADKPVEKKICSKPLVIVVPNPKGWVAA